MITRSILILVLSFAFYNVGNCQEAPTSAGGEASGVEGTASYSVGQSVYTANSGDNGSVSQGVQQAYSISIISGTSLNKINLQLSVYPNPTMDFLHLMVEEESVENLFYQLFDLHGKLIKNSQLKDKVTSINTDGLAASTYLLKVSDGKTVAKTFRIVKIK